MNEKIKQIKGISNAVLVILLRNEGCRDDDNKLTANVWYKEIKKLGHDPNVIGAEYFLFLYASNQITQSDVITRARRKIQEATPALRGTKWVERQKYCQ